MNQETINKKIAKVFLKKYFELCQEYSLFLASENENVDLTVVLLNNDGEKELETIKNKLNKLIE